MELLRKRKVGIEGLACSGCENIIEEELRKVSGIKAVKADYKGKTLDLEYNLLNVSLADIDKKVLELGYKLPQVSIAKAERNLIYRSEIIERNDFLGLGNSACAGCGVSTCYASPAKQGEKK